MFCNGVRKWRRTVLSLIQRTCIYGGSHTFLWCRNHISPWILTLTQYSIQRPQGKSTLSVIGTKCVNVRPNGIFKVRLSLYIGTYHIMYINLPVCIRVEKLGIKDKESLTLVRASNKYCYGQIFCIGICTFSSISNQPRTHSLSGRVVTIL